MGGLSADIYTSQRAGRDGATVTGKRLATRTIEITAQIRTNKTRYDAARELLMRTLRPRRCGRLVYENSLYTRHIPCVVRSAPEPARGVLPEFDVEFFCASPFWRGGDGAVQHSTSIAEYMDNLEWPLEITADGIELSYRSPNLVTTIVNDGD